MRLWEAAKVGDAAAVARVLGESACPNDPEQADQPSNRTALHLAAAGNFATVAALLIAAGADLETKSSSQRASLHVAAACGSVEVARLLLEGGARMDVRDEWGSSPMECARSAAMKELLRPYRADRDVLRRQPIPEPEPAPEDEQHQEPSMDLAAAQMHLIHLAAASGHAQIPAQPTGQPRGSQSHDNE